MSQHSTMGRVTLGTVYAATALVIITFLFVWQAMLAVYVAYANVENPAKYFFSGGPTVPQEEPLIVNNTMEAEVLS